MKFFIPTLLSLLLLTANLLDATQGVSDAEARGIAIQSNGTIVIGGYVTLNNVTQFMAARFTSFGNIDTSYGNQGYVAVPIGTSAQANGLVLLSNNEIGLAGSTQTSQGSCFGLAQLTTNGVLDTSFNLTGTTTTFIDSGCSGNGVAIQSNGDYIVVGVAIIVGAPVYALARYTSSGALDTAFGLGGIVVTPINFVAVGEAVILQSGGQILVGGFSPVAGVSNFTLACYNSADGSLDTTFNSSGSQPGVVSTPVGAGASIRALAVQSNGQIVAGGIADSNFALARYNTDGSLDTTFGTNGTVETSMGSSSQINGLAIQSNGMIVAAGVADQAFAVARYNTNGLLDTTFNSAGSLPGTITTAIGVSSEAFAVTLQSNGQIVVAGTSDNSAITARYNTNGLLDTTFGPNNGYNSFPNSSQAPDIFGITNVNIADDAEISYSKLSLANQILGTDINTDAAIADTQLGTIQTPGKVLNQATTATSSNVASAIVTRDVLGNFSANLITANLVGNVSGSAASNVLKAGDTMTGSLVLPAGSVANPSLQFSGNTNVGLSATSNILTLSTNGAGALSIDSNGAVTIATPGSSEVGLTINGGGAAIGGNISNSGNVLFNTSGTSLNAVGSTLGSLVKVYSGTGNTGLTGTVTINYSAAGFVNAPQIVVTSINGATNVLGINSATNTTASVLSSANVPFNYFAIGI